VGIVCFGQQEVLVEQLDERQFFEELPAKYASFPQKDLAFLSYYWLEVVQK
jgi:hypothetical protein